MSSLKSVVAVILQDVIDVSELDKKTQESVKNDVVRTINSLGYKTNTDYINLELDLLTLNMVKRTELKDKIRDKYMELR